MPREQQRYPALACVRPARPDAPYWRAVLERRWQVRLQELTELSVAYHGAAAPGPDGSGGGPGGRTARRLLRRAVAARRKLADTDEALDRLAAGRFGRCEQCWAAIGDGQLAAMPEARYCPHCASGAAPAAEAAGAAGPAGAVGVTGATRTTRPARDRRAARPGRTRSAGAIVRTGNPVPGESR